MSDIERKNDRKKVLLGLTGGVAAYKAAELVRRLGDRGIEVHVVMTEAACGFITPATLQALSGHPVYTSMWDGRIENGMPHIELSRDKDAIVVAPATAPTAARCQRLRNDQAAVASMYGIGVNSRSITPMVCTSPPNRRHA